MSITRSIDFLPEIFHSDANKTFLNATLDRLMSQPKIQRFSGFVGRQVDPQTGQQLSGAYLQEPTPFRQAYQLEPAFITANATSNVVTDVISWNDVLNSISINGGITDEWNRLLTGNEYSWRGFIDIDKIVNFQNYYWLAQGNSNADWYWDNNVIVSNNDVSANATFDVTRTSNDLRIDGYYSGNPEISLVRGGTYTFNISADPLNPLANLWIQTDPTVAGGQTFNPSISAQNVSGVTNNGITSGQITFTIPTVPANYSYLQLSTYGNIADYVDLATTLEYDQINGQPANNFTIDGSPQVIGKTVIFASNPTTGWGNIPSNEWQDKFLIGVDGSNNLTVTWDSAILSGYKVNITSGLTYRLQAFYNDSGTLTQVPSAALLNETFYLQDDTISSRSLKINVLNAIPQLDVYSDIIGQPFYTSGNGVEFRNGLKITFDCDNTVPGPYSNPNSSWIVEGVGDAIVLVPVSQLVIPESTLLLNNPPDYITINRASPDRNQWSTSNQWVHKDTVALSQSILAEQGVSFTIPAPVPAVRPIIEFRAGLQLFGMGNIALDYIGYVDIYALDAMSTVQTKPFYVVDGHQLLDGDMIVFMNDTDMVVRSTTYTASFVDPSGQIQQPLFRTTPVVAATTGDVSLSGLVIIDGYQIQNGDRVLVWNQTNTPDNGIYIASSEIWTRSSDLDTSEQFENLVGAYVLNGTVNGQLYIYLSSSNTNVVIGTTPITFVIAPAVPILELRAEQTVSSGNQVWILNGAEYADTTLVWNTTTQMWLFSTQSKKGLQQNPLFDMFDDDGNSFSNITVYPESTFVGDPLFTYALGTGPDDTILGFPLDYGPIGNLNDIIFTNNYDADSFVYNNGSVITSSISDGFAQITDPIEKTISLYEPWQFIDCANELYQNLQYTGVSQVTVTGTLMTDTAYPNKVFVDGEQLSFGEYSIVQDGANININITAAVSSDSLVFIKLMAEDLIADAWYDVPVSFTTNPFGQSFDQFLMSDLRTHATESMSNIDRNFIDDSQNFPVNILNTIYNGVPGSLIYNESLSVLPAKLLTNSSYNILTALKTAGQDYILFKQRFLIAAQSIPNIQLMPTKTAVDAIMAKLAVNYSSSSPWYTSDMVPSGGTQTNYTIKFTDQVLFNLQNSYDFSQPSNIAVLVCLNNSQLVINRDYTIDEQILTLTTVLNVGDILSVYEVANTDGCYVPATPTKLGLYNSYIPTKYVDNTYATPQTVILGHDGSITIAYGDYRDNLILDLELRIYNNLKVDNQLWSDTILSRVPNAGKWRNTTYSLAEQNQILQQFYDEWLTNYNVTQTASFYNENNPFTWNYSGCLDKTGGALPGAWRGIYNYLYDSTHPFRPWEMLNLTIQPSWWEEVYGPAPYTGQNNLLWNDLQNGIIRNPNGITYSSLGSRSQLDQMIPLDGSGNLLDPNTCVVGSYNNQPLDYPYVFGDGGPVETAWRQSSIFPFSKLRAQILQNPLFMCGTLWDLNNYLPTENGFRYEVTQFASINDVFANSPVNSILNYSLEYLTKQGLPSTNLQTDIDNTNVNLVYNMASFTTVNNLSIYAEQDSPTDDQGSSVQLPQEDFTLSLSERLTPNLIEYSGVIISAVDNGYAISGYNPINQSFTILVPASCKSGTMNVGQYTYGYPLTFSTQTQEVRYNTVLATQQDVINFLMGYAAYLESIGLQFNIDPTQQKVSWYEGTIQFIKWSLQKNQTLSLILNPAASVLEYTANIGTLQNILKPNNLLLDVNQKQITSKYLNVYREGNSVKITLQNNNVLACLQVPNVIYEHRLVVNNTTIFNDLIYNPITGLRQNRLKIAGQKTADWNGTLDIPGFMIVTSNVQAWTPNTDYIKYSLVSFKNVNYVATTNVIGSTTFQYDQFTVLPQEFTDDLIPNLSVKAIDLTRAYDNNFRTFITDIVAQRSAMIGYTEKDWLNGLGIDLASQTSFYQGWIKEKGSLSAVNAYGRGSTPEFSTAVDIYQEYAVRVGDYGATSLTGFGEVQLVPSNDILNPIIVSFVDQIDTDTTGIIQVTPSTLYQKSPNWTNDFVSIQGNIKADQTNFALAGPVIPDYLIDYAQNLVPYFNSTDQEALFFENRESLITSSLQQNILKLAEYGSMFWLESDVSVQETTQWNVIQYPQANAYVTSISQSGNLLQFTLTGNISAVTNSSVVIDHVDADSNIQIQGTFPVESYMVAPGNGYISILTVNTASANISSINSVTYDPPFSSKTVYPEISLRGNSIGEVSTGNKPYVFVEFDNGGWASYQFNEPYPVVITSGDVPGQVPNDALAYDVNNNILWVAKSQAIGNSGRVEKYNIVNVTNEQGVIEPQTQLLSTNEIVTERSDTYNLGYNCVSCNNDLVAVSARQTDGPGQVYIGSASEAVIQILGTTNSDINFGQALASSADGKWLYVGSPANSGNGIVSAYALKNTTPYTYVATYTSSTTVTLSGNAAPDSAYSLQVILNDDEMLMAGIDYTVSGNIVTFTNAISDADTFFVVQLGTYYKWITDIEGTNSNFGLVLAADTNGSTLAVGNPAANTVYVLQRAIDKTYNVQPINVLMTSMEISAGDVDVYVNGNIVSPSNYIVGSNTITFNSPTATNSVIEVQSGVFTPLQTITAPNAADKMFGSSISISNNQMVIGCPGSIAGSTTVLNKGRVYLYILDTNQTNKTVAASSLELSAEMPIHINNWLVYLTGSSGAQLIAAINSLTVYSGISAALNSAGTSVIITNNGSEGIGIRTLEVQSLNNTFALQATIENSDSKQTMMGQVVNWLSTDLFGVVSNYIPSYTTNPNAVFNDATTFDSGNTVLEYGAAQPTQWLVLYQVLTTNRSYVDENADIIQVVPVNTIQNSGVSGAETVFAGDINVLWVGNPGTPDQAPTLYYNPNSYHGWTRVGLQSTLLEPRSITRSWLYDPTTNTKLVDLEVADLATGYLPGSISQNLNYICDFDPACYNYPQWQSGLLYNIGDRVIYNNLIWQSLYQGRSGSIFNSALWQQITPENEFTNTGVKKWGAEQVGKTWFKTDGLRAINYQLGDIGSRATNWNQWFPNANIQTYEWVNSNVAPAQFTNNSNNGYVFDVNCPYTYDSTTGLYGFWVTEKQSVSPVQGVSIVSLAQNLSNITAAGIPIISPIDTNTVALWNVGSYILSSNAILHIDYVSGSGSDLIHSEFVLLSNDGEKTWYTTPLYNKFIDSMVGQTVNYQLVPDYTLPLNQQYGILQNPQQSLFVDRPTALLIYFQVVNSYLANVAINSSAITSILSGTTPIPAGGYNQVVPNREVLAGLNPSNLPYNYRVLIQSDDQVCNDGWSVVANMNGTWQFAMSQTYDVSAMWSAADWSASTYTGAPPTYTINNIGELPSLTLSVGATIGVLGDNYAVYQVVQNPNIATQLDLEPLYLENGTIQFSPELYNFPASGIGWDMAPYDTIRAWDDDPYNEIRIILEALNSQILVGSTANIADDAFFSILNYIIYENKNLDWLFRTSFVTVDYNVGNLQTSASQYFSGNAQIVEDFIAETLPYHTRVREFNDTYTGNDVFGIQMTDFDLPAQYDPLYAQLVAENPAPGKPTSIPFSSAPTLQQFSNVGLATDAFLFYVSSNGLPEYSVNDAVAQEWVFGIKINGAQDDSVKYTTANNNVGPIGVAINGVPYFSPDSGQTEVLYLSSNIAVSQTFTINTVYALEQDGVNLAPGWANATGVFEYLVNPTEIYTANPDVHSPILGYAFDGNPIYGPYGYANIDGTGGITRQISSYELSDIERLDPTDQPIVNGLQTAVYAAPTGKYIEDYDYNLNIGTLDQYNGRFCTTPDYPNGTYAYFITIDSDSNPAYPYVLGPQYWGIPTGLHYEYVNGVNTPIYSNGDYTMPSPSNVSFVRSPDGSISTDSITLTTVPAYTQWANNYTYSVGSIEIINSGNGYVSPTVQIISTNGLGSGAVATAQINANTGIETITVINAGSGYTATPIITVIDPDATANCVAYPIMENGLIRKIDTTLRFDRVNYTTENLNANYEYNIGDVVLSGNVFYAALVNNPGANVANTNAWEVASNVAIAESTALNRIYDFYQPTANMPGNDPKLLMYGLDYAGVNVNDIYKALVPSGPIHNIDDSLLGNTILNISWDPGLISDSAFSTQTFVFGERSGQFSANTSTYIQANTNSNIALNTSDFTIEFFCKFSQLEVNGSPAIMTLLDSRMTANSTSGWVIFKTEDNALAFGENEGTTVMSGGGLTTNVWQFVTVQKFGSNLYLYLDGQIVDQTTGSYDFTDNALTLGANIAGDNICTGYMDELRITANTIRYPNPTNSFAVPTQAFPTEQELDPYFIPEYTYVLYGFEGIINEATLDVTFSGVNNEYYMRDLSWNSKNIELVNISNIAINSNPFGNIGTGLGTVLAVGMNI